MLDGRAEAHLIALSCSDPPEGREHWSMRLLADRMVELGYGSSALCMLHARVEPSNYGTAHALAGSPPPSAERPQFLRGQTSRCPTLEPWRALVSRQANAPLGAL